MNNSISTKAGEIWDWFEEHQVDLLFALEDGEQQRVSDILHEFNILLHYYYPSLTAGVNLRDHDVRLVITAAGMQGHFEEAEELVGFAPKLPGWEILALTPAAMAETTCQVGDMVLDSRDVWFEPIGGEYPKMGVRLYVKGYDTAENKTAFKSLMLLMLQEMAGEKSFALDIGRIEGAPLEPEDPEARELFPIKDLAKQVTKHYERLAAGN